MRPFQLSPFRRSTVTFALTLLACEPNRPLSPPGHRRLSVTKEVSTLDGGAFFVAVFFRPETRSW